MEFNEKLQELRKNRGLTQEEAAEALYVSRTAISKWESGRGYPSIDSLKEIARFYSVTIDELLSGEEIVSIAEKENKSNIQRLCNLMFAAADLFSLMLIILPLYPNAEGGQIYPVSLMAYTGISPFAIMLYWVFILLLSSLGTVKLLLTRFKAEKMQKAVTAFSMALGVLAVLLFVITKEPYAAAVVFGLLVIKTVLLFKQR